MASRVSVALPNAVETEVVAAVPGKSVHVLGMELTLSASGQVIIEDAVEGIELMHVILAIGRPLILPIVDDETPWFSSGVGKGIVIATGGASVGTVELHYNQA